MGRFAVQPFGGSERVDLYLPNCSLSARTTLISERGRATRRLAPCRSTAELSQSSRNLNLACERPEPENSPPGLFLHSYPACPTGRDNPELNAHSLPRSGTPAYPSQPLHLSAGAPPRPSRPLRENLSLTSAGTGCRLTIISYEVGHPRPEASSSSPELNHRILSADV